MKKSIQRVKSYFRRPKYINPAFENNVRVLEIEPEADKIYEALGITRNRFNELMDHLHEIPSNNTTLAEKLVHLSGFCKHQNELAMMSYVMGGFVVRQFQIH